MKCTLPFVIVTAIFQCLPFTSFEQNYLPECVPGRFYAVTSKEIHSFRLENNSIKYDGIAVPALPGSDCSALAIAKLDGTYRFYSTREFSIIKLLNDWQVVYSSADQGYSNGGGNGANLYFDGFSATGASIYRFDGTNVTKVVNSFKLGIADLAADDDGNLYYFDNPNYDNNLLLNVVSPAGNLIASYPLKLDPNNGYGTMLMGNVLYVAFGPAAVHPNSLLPITLTGRAAVMGNYISMPPDAPSFIDLASCVSARVPLPCINGPAAPLVAVTQPNCTSNTGSIIITNPAIPELTYLLNDTVTSSNGIFKPLVPGFYRIIAQDSSTKCISKETAVIINAAPVTPPAPVLTVTQPACPVNTGTIKVEQARGSGLRYSIDGIQYTNTTGIFTGLTSGTYTVTTSNTFCTSGVSTAIIDSLVPLRLTLAASPANAGIGTLVNLAATANTNFTITGWEPASLFPDQTAATQHIVLHNTDKFTVTGKTTGNCAGTASVVISTNLPGNIIVPNAFTPNNDHLNDVLYVYGNRVKKFELTIWNRWGEKVFTSTRQEDGWNGDRNSKPQPPGAYVYLLKFTGNDDKEVIRKGNIVLIR